METDVRREVALSLSSVFAGYGRTVVLEDISLLLDGRRSVSIIGRNGMGKTTLLSTIMGFTRLHGGRVEIFGTDVSNARTWRRVRTGVGLVPQEREIFPSLTVHENIAIALRPGDWDVHRIYDLFPRLYERRTNFGNRLSGGEQQMLAIGRALAGNPRVLLMDEPTEGLAPVIVEELQGTFAKLRSESGMAILLVEQNSRVALEFAERCVVMSGGRIAWDGDSENLKRDPALLDRLIGVEGRD
jgi:branched-chain amino acid transport system ATP-binding protein